MVVEGLFSAAGRFVKSSRSDDDIVDRLNHQYTVVFLVIFSILVSTTQYVGQPIHCWCPAYFTGNHEEYTNRICWVSYTYSVPERSVPGVPGVSKRHIGYYQWVPLVLLVQALLFYVPCLVWRIFSERSGININNLVEAAETIQNALYPERRDKTIKYMIRHLDHYLDYQREYRGGCCAGLKQFLARHFYLLCGNRYGNYLLTLYLSIKCLYLANSIAQLFLLNAFLGTNFHFYGVEILLQLFMGHLVNGEDVAPRFPRITLCDFTIRQMGGNLHNHTVQCVLPINFFNEKIYIFLWFWFVFIASITTLSFSRWAWQICFRYSRIRYVRKHLKVMGKLTRDSDRDRKLSHKFAQMYLRQDGVFVLRLVAKNSTDLVVADIVSALWDNYKNKPIFSNRADELDFEEAGDT